jgi:succinate dehydrogenase / fumarate reductase flavoprotein subunit
MNDLVGIIRKAEEIQAALVKLGELKERAAKVGVEGHRQFNPGWHLALDLRNMLVVSEAVAKAALLRQESRGGHTRDDYPAMDPHWREKNLICSIAADGTVAVVEQPMIPMRSDLINLFDRDELKKYLTDEEMNALGPKETTTS